MCQCWLLPARLHIPNSKTISAPAASRPTTKLQCGESQSPAARPRHSLIGHLVASNGLQPTREQHRDADYQQRWRFLKQTEFIVPIDRNLTCCTKPADLVRPDRTAATSITWTVCTSQRTTILNLDIFILTNKIFCSLSECSADGNNFLYRGRLKYVLAFHILEVSEQNTIGVITCRPPTLCCWPVKTLTLPTHSSLTLTYWLTVRHLYESVSSPDRTLFVFFFRSHRKSIWKYS